MGNPLPRGNITVHEGDWKYGDLATHDSGSRVMFVGRLDNPTVNNGWAWVIDLDRDEIERCQQVRVNHLAPLPE